MAQKRFVVGIDVAKGKVDVAIRCLNERATFERGAVGEQELLAWLARHGAARAVMEASGGYEKRWAQLLRKAGLEVVIVDPKRVRHFAKSAGRLAKNDVIDAGVIAWFGETFDDLHSHSGDADREELDQLVTARSALARLQAEVDGWSEQERPKPVQKAHQAVLKALAAQIARLEAAIARKIDKTADFSERAEIIESVPGLAKGSAAGVVAFLPELGRVDRQAAAALVGIAPFDNESGNWCGPRCIQGGRQKLRNLLYMPVMGAATKHNPVLKAYYGRLIAKGKKAKVALIACMRKLITILNAMLARKEKWDAAKFVPA